MKKLSEDVLWRWCRRIDQWVQNPSPSHVVTAGTFTLCGLFFLAWLLPSVGEVAATGLFMLLEQTPTGLIASVATLLWCLALHSDEERRTRAFSWVHRALCWVLFTLVVVTGALVALIAQIWWVGKSIGAVNTLRIVCAFILALSYTGVFWWTLCRFEEVQDWVEAHWPEVVASWRPHWLQALLFALTLCALNGPSLLTEMLGVELPQDAVLFLLLAPMSLLMFQLYFLCRTLEQPRYAHAMGRRL